MNELAFEDNYRNLCIEGYEHFIRINEALNDDERDYKLGFK